MDPLFFTMESSAAASASAASAASVAMVWGQPMPEDTEEVERAFRDYLGKGRMTAFTRAVREYHALVAGGSVVSVFGGFPIHDLDVYVNRSHAESFLVAMESMGMVAERFHMASEYDDSFFRKNHISVRFPLKGKSDRGVEHPLLMDVMVIPDEIVLESVVTNFDLTFCEVWWDGHVVRAVDPEGLRTNRGQLKPAYHTAFFQEANTFLLRRVLKYRQRGFLVDLRAAALAFSSKADASAVDPGAAVTRKKTMVDPHSWAVRQLLEWIIDQFGILQRCTDDPVSATTLYFRLCPPSHRMNAEGWTEWVCRGDRGLAETLAGMAYADRVGAFFLPDSRRLFLRVFPGASQQFRNRCAVEYYRTFKLGDALWTLFPLTSDQTRTTIVRRFHESSTWRSFLFSPHCSCDLCRSRSKAYPPKKSM